jgi:predicted membrane protein
MRPTEPKQIVPAPSSDPSTDAIEARDHLFRTRDLVLGGLFGALGIVVPVLFHAVGLGKVFLPMYLPILALGLTVSWEVALIVGVATPLVSAVLTGMPPLAPPIAVLMALELACLSASASLARRAGLAVWPAAVGAILAARAVGTAALVTVGRLMGLEQTVWQYAVVSFLLSWPGIVLQLTVVPAAVYAIERSSILGRR